MSWRIERETRMLAERLERGDPFWPAQVTVAAAIALNLALTNRITIGPFWLHPGIEGVLLVALVVISPRRASEHSRVTRCFALCVIGIVNLAKVVSLALLMRYLVRGGKASGHQLRRADIVLACTKCLLFAVR